MLDICGHLMYI